jgi:anaerobic magnesium-protoporphyrin IX monomethyl ester cyclase
MKVQFIVPPGGYFARRWSKGSSMPPLGLLYLGAILERGGHDVRILPADILGSSWRDVKQEIQDFEPDIIGSSCLTENRFQSFKLIRLCKKVQPLALTVLGGPHASMAAEDTLTHLPELDAVVRGEGEITVGEICKAIDSGRGKDFLDKTTGVSYNMNGKIQTNPSRPPIQDLDSLPFPAFHLIPLEKYNFFMDVPGWGKLPAVNMITSRGCPHQCNFCATPVHWGHRVRKRSAQNIVTEIEYLVKKYGVRVIYFCDDTFNASPRRVEEICELLLGKKLNVFWKCDVRIDLMAKPLLRLMKEAGLFHLSFGLEAGAQRVRTEIVNKPIDIDSFHRLIQWCHELNIIPNAFFILSHPTETREEAEKTIRIIEEYGDRIESSIALLHIYPGTPLEKRARKMGVLPAHFSWTKRDRSISILPAAQGDVPLFLDSLGWAQISELLFRWSLSSGKYAFLEKTPKILTDIHSIKDIKKYATIGFIYAKIKLKKIFKKNI